MPKSIDVDLARVGPRVDVRLSAPGGRSVRGSALVDTGSTISVVSTTLVRELALTPTRAITVRTVGTESASVHEYLVRVELPDAHASPIDLRCVAIDLGADTIALLGRDFLSRAVLVYDGVGGAFSLTVPMAR